MNKEKKQNKGKRNKRGILSRLFKILLRTVLIGLFLIFSILVSFFLLFNVAAFRAYVAEKVSSIASNALAGDIELDEVYINPFSGLYISDIKVYAAGDTLAHIELLSVYANFASFYDLDLKISSIQVDNPKFKLLRNRNDSTWNFTKLIKPTDEDEDTSNSKSKLKIDLRDLSINNSEIIIIDSTAEFVDSEKLNLNNIHLFDLNLNLKAFADLSKNDFSLDLKRFNFYELNSNKRLSSFSLAANVDTLGIELENLNLELDDNDIGISANLENINVFEDDIGEAIYDTPFEIEFITDPVNLDYLVEIVPIPLGLSGIFNIDGSFSGTLNDISINELYLKSEGIELNLEGKFEGIKDKNISYNVNISDSYLTRNKLLNTLPTLNLSGIPKFGNAHISELKAKGGTDHVEARVIEIYSDMGDIIGKAESGDFNKDIYYSYSGTVKDFDLSKVIDNNDLTTNINADLTATGKGKAVDDLIFDIDINSTNSIIKDYKYEKMKAEISSNGGGLFKIDTMYIVKSQGYEDQVEFTGVVEPEIIKLSGFTDFGNIEMPIIDLELDVEALNIYKLTGNESTPRYLSGKIIIDTEGIVLDSLKGSIIADIDQCIFYDRSLFPFEIDLQMTREDNFRKLVLNSEIMQVDLSGEFSYNELLKLVSSQAIYLKNYVQNKINIIQAEKTLSSNQDIELSKTKNFEPAEINLRTEVKDLSLFNAFFPDKKIDTDIIMDFSLEVTDSSSILSIDSILVRSFSFEDSSNNISSTPVYLYGNLQMSLKDSLPNLDFMNISFKCEKNIEINDMMLEESSFDIDYFSDKLNFNVNSGINSIIDAETRGKVLINQNNFELIVDSLRTTYLDTTEWRLSKDLIAYYDADGIKLEQLILNRNKAETIVSNGYISTNEIRDLKINIYNFPLDHISRFIPESDQFSFDDINGQIDSLSIIVDGYFDDIYITASMLTSEIFIFNKNVGTINADIAHNNGRIIGGLETRKKIEGKKELIKTLDIDINSLPLNLSPVFEGERFSKIDPIEISVRSNQGNLALVNPFLTGISDIEGKFDASIDIFGYYPEDLSYQGSINVSSGSLILDATNIYYEFNADIGIETDLIEIRSINLRNNKYDSKNGKALASGRIEFKGLKLEYIEISSKVDDLKVMSEATSKSMPNIYGDLIVSTVEPLVFGGTMDAPFLKGAVNINFADLKMPGEFQEKINKSIFKYRIKGNKIEAYYKIDSLSDENNVRVEKIKIKDQNDEQNFADLINYDVSVYIPGRFTITMDITSFGQLVAQIKTLERDEPIRYVKTRNSSDANLYGQLELRDGSTLNFLKLFNTSGIINFPTGDISNPSLDLKAVYSNEGQFSGETKPFSVIIDIEGTKEQPDVSFSYMINGQEQQGDSSQIREDALMLLLFGTTKAELNAGSGAGTDDLLVKGVGTSAISSIGSKALTDLFQGTGIIQNVDLNLGDDVTSWENASIKFSGRLFGDARWKVGGTVADLSSNNEFTLELPLELGLNQGLLREAILQFTRSVNPNTATSINQKEWEVKLRFNHSW